MWSLEPKSVYTWSQYWILTVQGYIWYFHWTLWCTTCIAFILIGFPYHIVAITVTHGRGIIYSVWCAVKSWKHWLIHFSPNSVLVWRFNIWYWKLPCCRWGAVLERVLTWGMCGGLGINSWVGVQKGFFPLLCLIVCVLWFSSFICLIVLSSRSILKFHYR